MHTYKDKYVNVTMGKSEEGVRMEVWKEIKEIIQEGSFASV